mmetsp:Transcript_24844/g.44692  ORF Transcript_24844/g.44692 Transcript_24844/m.44692 type:complete len:252 (+) Transcript_24844:357-1112(+)
MIGRLIQHVFVFHNTRIVHFGSIGAHVLWMIHHGRRLEVARSIPLDNQFKRQRSIFQFGPSQIGKVGINGSSVVQTLALELVLHLKVIRISQHRNFGGRQHILKDGCVPLLGQCLMRIREVSSIMIIPHWNPRQDLGPQLCWILGPLLERIRLENQIVKPLSDPRQCHLFRIDRLPRIAIVVLQMNLFLRQPLIHLFRTLNIQIEQFIHRIDIHRNGNKLPIHHPQHFVFVGDPVGEFLYVFPYPFVFRVE